VLKKGIDLLSVESSLVDAKFSPAIIPNVPVDCLIDLTGAAEGPVWAFRAFCKEWTAHLEKKKQCLLSD